MNEQKGILLMTILSNNSLLDHLYSKTSENLFRIINPKNQIATLNNYTDMIQGVDELLRETALVLLKDSLEEMDEMFFNSQGRKRDYYVKMKRERTLITLFGQVTFNRRIYESKTDGTYYIHVDRKMGLPKYDRYDPTVKAKVVEAYANQNSMIKVGEIIGESMYAIFSKNIERKNFNLSRQTVHNILKNAPKLIPNIKRHDQTPKKLYIMADEKYIPIQKSEKDNVMVKQLVLFEEVVGEGKRLSLQKKIVFTRLKGNIWSQFHDYLSTVYDLDKVEKITVLGDGANWIKLGRYELPKTEFILDAFHGFQAINHITTDEGDRSDLRTSIFHDNREEFIEIIDDIKEEFKEDENRLETIESKFKYLINNWQPIQRGLKDGVPGCSMEAQISHNLAAVYTSRPKAYKIDNLETYIYYRDLNQNNVDILNAYLNTFNDKKTNKAQYIEKEVIDLSFFDPRPRYDKSSTSNWLKGFISKH